MKLFEEEEEVVEVVENGAPKEKEQADNIDEENANKVGRKNTADDEVVNE